MINKQRGNSSLGLLASISLLITIYFSASFLYQQSVKSAVQEMLRESMGKKIVVEQVYLQGWTFFDQIRLGDALVRTDGETSLMEIKVRGNGLWQPLYIEIPGTEVVKLKFNNFFN